MQPRKGTRICSHEEAQEAQENLAANMTVSLVLLVPLRGPVLCFSSGCVKLGELFKFSGYRF
jgi:hypothetical protein